MYRKISAHYVINNGEVIKNGIITVDKSGKILDLKSAGDYIKEISGMEFYSGVLVPGFVNAHCHLELSHLKDKLSRHTGLHGFVSKITNLRASSDEEIQRQMQISDNEMFKNGIVAVGDISNKPDSINIKLKSNIKYHTFVELFANNFSIIHNVLSSGKELENTFRQAGLLASIVPHAPYSVHPKLLDLIVAHLAQSQSIMSIHNQECQSENELFINKTGALYDTFTAKGIDLQGIPKTGKSSLISIAEQFNAEANTILVHNTVSNQDDVEFANQHLNNIFWCFCPNANLYIENLLPDINMFRRKKQKICIGTDSLASNSQLSVLEELKVISAAFPEIPLEELIDWASINGAQALKMDNELGDFTINKRSGINLIENLDLNRLKLTPESKVRKIV